MTEQDAMTRPEPPAPAPEDPYPSLDATFWISLFFGPFGFLPADSAAQKAHAKGLPTARYWICFLMTWLFIGPLLVAVVVLTASAA